MAPLLRSSRHRRLYSQSGLPPYLLIQASPRYDRASVRASTPIRRSHRGTFRVNAVDELVRRDTDNQTIGLLICKDMDRTEVQLAFQGITTPMGVATYDNVRIKEIEKQLPSAEQIKAIMDQAEEEFMREQMNKE